MVAPPRFRVDVDKGALIFTAGAVTHYDKAVGFRVYDRFQESHASHGQVVVVFDSDTGDFKGVIVGGHLGAMRTGAIGDVAIKHMARPDASRAAILGSGRQARTHLAAAAVVRHFASVKVYSPNATHREAFAREMRETLDLTLPPLSQHKRLSRMPMWSFASPRAPRPCSIPLAQTRRPRQHRRAPGPGRE
jgi:ornithine cyclodeaminase/alanine dehydrogenase-like protein (mu-crystallin family)